jgi:DNA-binding TFAR19-related protein (PDSD5 family)|tara:strand:+ start:1209 stop:1622 length:414 start_codon:yes stop_codon:yes gene_type:complete
LSDDDSELQRLQAKRLAEMQKNISSRETVEETLKPTEEKIVNPRDVLIKQLGFRGLEVLTNAESQFPNETKMIIDKLYELIKTGEITEVLDGGKLLGLFRSIGLSVRMDTKINIQQDGKFVSLTDKLSNKPDNDDAE